MQALPVGLPKLMVSTMAAGDTSDYVGGSRRHDDALVTDVAGINPISRGSWQRGGRHGRHGAGAPRRARTAARPLVGATMFGVTTPCVNARARRSRSAGYEVLVFHATGTGGQAMEALVDDGLLAGVLDLTTTELADDLVGGVLSAGPERLEAAGAPACRRSCPLGALDMVNFGPRDTVPPKFADRNLYVHNPTVTLMRTTPEEMRGAGPPDRRASSPRPPARSSLFVPLRGVSAIDAEGSRSTTPRPTPPCSTRCATGSQGSASSWSSSTTTQRRGVRDRDGRQARRATSEARR